MLTDIRPLSFPPSDNSGFVWIAGPCSAESEEQVMQTARDLHAQGIRYFRAGLWKPRTRPGGFEGVGTRGLPWLQRVRDELGMRVATEVGNSRHVSDALNAGIDLLWLGARSVSSPFVVAEVAEAVRGNNEVTILVKNPINPDVELWHGALQRLYDVGIRQLGAIHRGFSTYAAGSYRNPPHWQIPIELRRRLPGLTILGDPSHIAGTGKLIGEVCQQAAEMHYDGLIVEAHCCPCEALSDAAQQITPAELAVIRSRLRLPAEVHASLPLLEAWRAELDDIDINIIGLLSRRMAIASDIGRYKRARNLSVLQSMRFRSMLEERCRQAGRSGLNPKFVSDLFSSIHEASINVQQDAADKGE